MNISKRTFGIRKPRENKARGSLPAPSKRTRARRGAVQARRTRNVRKIENLLIAKGIKDTSIGAPATKFNRAVIQQPSLAVECFAKLSPLAQHELTAMCPGSINTPYVENNGEISKLPTSTIHGHNELTTSPAAGALYSLVTLCPIYGLTSVAANAGIGYVDNLALTYTPTAINIQGSLFTDWYGSTTFTSKNVAYATRLVCQLRAPEATLSGQVFIGCLPASTLIGSTIASLMDYSVQQIDLKDTATWELRSAIQNRALVHEPQAAGTATFADEMVAYAVISSNATANITTGVAAGYTMCFKAHSNMVWWPLSSSPILSSVSQRQVDSIAPRTPNQDEFCNIASSHAANPQPTSMSTLLKMVNVMLTGASVVPMLSPYANIAKTALSAFTNLSDPRSDIPELGDIINDIEWYLHSATTRWTRVLPVDIEEVISLWFDQTNTLLSVLRAYQDKATRLKKEISSCQQRVVTDRKGSRVCFFKGDTEVVFSKEGIMNALYKRRSATPERPFDDSVLSDFIKK